jgi:putative SOS response-associated peptidase YedK
LPIVRFEPKAGERSLDLTRWGLVPFWAKDIKGQLRQLQRQGRRHRHPAELPRGVPAAALLGAGR